MPVRGEEGRSEHGARSECGAGLGRTVEEDGTAQLEGACPRAMIAQSRPVNRWARLLTHDQVSAKPRIPRRKLIDLRRGGGRSISRRLKCLQD